MRPLYIIAILMLNLLAWSASAHNLDDHALPLGDGKVSSSPQRGYVFACAHTFRGGGAQHAGNWIHGRTWDATQKINVQGAVSWPEAFFTVDNVGNQRQLNGNGLPLNHTTGIFPVQPSDPAYQIDRNPNAIHAQDAKLVLPRNPQMAPSPSCVPMGMIGITLNGIALYNALDDAGRDAVAHEVQDKCSGHPQMRGQYHYHGPSPCIEGIKQKTALLGYALDGFGIYSAFDENGHELTNADLDECHGRTSEVRWDGQMVTMYHYVLTREYPYTIGCFRGTPVQGNARRDTGAPPDRPMRPMQQRERGEPRMPPAEAVQACAGRMAGTSCQFTTPMGHVKNGACREMPGTVACVPDR